jgi:hypothetical protein
MTNAACISGLGSAVAEIAPGEALIVAPKIGVERGGLIRTGSCRYCWPLRQSLAQRFQNIPPGPAARLGVQTIAEHTVLPRKLLKAFGSATGLPAGIHASFNAIREAIVCTRCDAVRVFYETWLKCW